MNVWIEHKSTNVVCQSCHGMKPPLIQSDYQIDVQPKMFLTCSRRFRLQRKS